MGGAVWTPALQQKTRSPSNSSTLATTMRSTLATAPAWAACFTPNATFSNPRQSVTGRAALAAYAADFSKGLNARYWINNLMLEPQGKGARGSCYLLLLHVAAAGEPASTATPSCRWKTVGCSQCGTLPVTSSHGIVTASPPASKVNPCSLGRTIVGTRPLLGYSANTSGQGPVWMPAALVRALPRAVRNTVSR